MYVELNYAHTSNIIPSPFYRHIGIQFCQKESYKNIAAMDVIFFINR